MKVNQPMPEINLHQFGSDGFSLKKGLTNQLKVEIPHKPQCHLRHFSSAFPMLPKAIKGPWLPTERMPLWNLLGFLHAAPETSCISTVLIDVAAFDPKNKAAKQSIPLHYSRTVGQLL